MWECFAVVVVDFFKLLPGCTDGRVKLWVYAVTAVGFILILFIIALSFLLWYEPYCLLIFHFALLFFLFLPKNKSSVVADAYFSREQPKH